MSPPPSPTLAPTSSKVIAKLVQIPSPTKAAIATASDDNSADDVQFVSEIIHSRPRKKRRKAIDPATPTVLITPETTPNKGKPVPASKASASPNPGPATPAKRNRKGDPTTPSTPSILVGRTPSPPIATPAARPPRPPPLYSIPPYIPPIPAKKTHHRPWNAKLFASLAESLQHAFSFENFAAEHGRPVSEVLDVFSACVQLPLLGKGAEGLAKGGNKAREAIKEFQDLRKEVRAIHSAEAVLVGEHTTGTRAPRGSLVTQNRENTRKA
ncbi:MAG: hypothetical protein M1840_000298 [Geoglossum simile]|nr:MAG: hypothetical protein M1840_000298 [Geoglossum simile]